MLLLQHQKTLHNYGELFFAAFAQQKTLHNYGELSFAAFAQQKYFT